MMRSHYLTISFQLASHSNNASNQTIVNYLYFGFGRILIFIFLTFVLRFYVSLYGNNMFILLTQKHKNQTKPNLFERKNTPNGYALI